MAHSAKLIGQEGGEVRYITAVENGRPAWYFLKLSPERYPEYKKRMQTGTLDLRQYGDILVSGWGEAAPPGVLMEMKERHGVQA